MTREERRPGLARWSELARFERRLAGRPPAPAAEGGPRPPLLEDLAEALGILVGRHGLGAVADRLGQPYVLVQRWVDGRAALPPEVAPAIWAWARSEGLAR